MISFVDRKSELEALERSFATAGASFFVLYGRRRLGKTALLREFASSRPGVYYVGDRMTEKDNLRFLSRTMAHALGEDTMAVAEYPDWYALLAAFDRFRPAGKTYLILDEYQYLVQAQPALSSILQKWWDEHWQHQEMMLILCGSVTSMMYRETLAASSPLYGRRTGQWLLEPLRFKDFSLIIPGVTGVERLKLWSLVGGVPHYASLASSKTDFEQAFADLVLSRDGALFTEAKFLLQEEIAVPSVYWSLLHAIGNGVTRISELGARLALPGNQLTRYLGVLGDLRIVARQVPVTEVNAAKSKRGTYQITDPFLRLWFGCVAPYESLLELGRIPEARQLMGGTLDGHFAWAFEGVCRQLVEDLVGEPEIVRAGRYWDRQREIDVVAVNEKAQPVLAAACKWTARPVDCRVLQELREKVHALWPDRAADIELAIFCPGGFTQELVDAAQGSRVRLISSFG